MGRVQPVTHDRDLQVLVDLIDQSLLARLRSTETFQASRKIFVALRVRIGFCPASEPQQLDVCSELVAALAEAKAAMGPMPGLADACAALQPRLSWWRRMFLPRA